MHHRRHVELDHLLVHRIPELLVGERRVLPVAARGIGIEVAADEAQLLDATLELLEAARVRRRHARRLRQHAHADEIVGKERADAVDEVVACDRPFLAGLGVAEMVRHAGGARREDGEVGAALLLQLQLRADDALADLVVGDGGARRALRRVIERGDLRLAPALVLFRRRRVVAVAIDDHVSPPSPSSRSLGDAMEARRACQSPRARGGAGGVFHPVGRSARVPAPRNEATGAIGASEAAWQNFRG